MENDTINRHRPQDDVPEEVWLKNLLESYFITQKKLDFLRSYAKGLEEENMMLKSKLDSLNKQVEHVPSLEKENKQLKNEMRVMKNELDKLLPLKLLKTKKLVSLNLDYRRYIKNLQSLLDEHGIAYKERIPLYNHPFEGEKLTKLEKELTKL